jgi:ABC-type glycerol-3-phosphate transport system substrate-binding protein
MKRTIALALLALLLASACTAAERDESAQDQASKPTVTVYRTPT